MSAISAATELRVLDALDDVSPWRHGFPKA